MFDIMLYVCIGLFVILLFSISIDDDRFICYTCLLLIVSWILLVCSGIVTFCF